MKRKRHPITLLEVMIVVLLIGLIGGVLSYNLKGTMERGKKFRTEQGIARLKEILELEIERGKVDVDKLTKDLDYVKDIVRESGFIPPNNIDTFVMDGWKEPYYITYTNENQTLHVSSHTLDRL
jgi:general secretion pathway protein G